MTTAIAITLNRISTKSEEVLLSLKLNNFLKKMANHSLKRSQEFFSGVLNSYIKLVSVYFFLKFSGNDFVMIKAVSMATSFSVKVIFSFLATANESCAPTLEQMKKSN